MHDNLYKKDHLHSDKDVKLFAELGEGYNVAQQHSVKRISGK